MIRLGKNRRKKAEATPSCECGNTPLTQEDLDADGRCKCCREGHFTPHDFSCCTRCRMPIEMIYPDRGFPVSP
jgi:hypothetical protein